jgi:tRNA(adenine34) deaminase
MQTQPHEDESLERNVTCNACPKGEFQQRNGLFQSGWRSPHWVILYLVLTSRVLASDMGSDLSGKRPLTNAAGRLALLALDRERMAALVAFTARSLNTDNPRPFGALVIHTKTGKLLVRALNAVRQRCDPSAHAEVQAVRLATRRIKEISLAGYTLYTTCEPCPMCMSAALWAGLDRVVYGATIADANRHCNQIQIPATEVAAHSDMKCVVDGPILRDECYHLFTHPRMLRAFKLWSTGKRK